MLEELIVEAEEPEVKEQARYLKDHSHEYLRKPKPSVLKSELQERLTVLKQRVSRNLLEEAKAETQRDSELSQRSKQFKTEEDIGHMQRALSQYHI